MGRFSTVENAMWTDPAFIALPTDARLLFIWGWTNPTASICGLYHASMKMMQRALQEGPLADVERVQKALGALGQKPLMLWDANAELVLVVNRARHANRSPKVALAMQREVESCPSSPLVEQFVELHGNTLNLRLRKE
jgi:hypothetical protein